MINKKDIHHIPNLNLLPLSITVPIKSDHKKDNSSTLEVNTKTLQTAKKISASSLTQIVEQRTWENNQLRQELAYQQKKHGASMYLFTEMQTAIKALQQALYNFQRSNIEIEKEETVLK